MLNPDLYRQRYIVYRPRSCLLNTQHGLGEIRLDSGRSRSNYKRWRYIRHRTVANSIANGHQTIRSLLANLQPNLPSRWAKWLYAEELKR